MGELTSPYTTPHSLRAGPTAVLAHWPIMVLLGLDVLLQAQFPELPQRNTPKCHVVLGPGFPTLKWKG